MDYSSSDLERQGIPVSMASHSPPYSQNERSTGIPISMAIPFSQPQPHPQPRQDERSFMILKRKLATLKYTEHLDVSSCALVDRLVDDLIRTTEGYQILKVKEHQKQLESSAFQSKVCATQSAPCCCHVHLTI
jgi:hypothetical protein